MDNEIPRLGKDKDQNPQNKEISRNNFELLPITFDHVRMVETLAGHHRDPFDRLLAAQAMLERLPILSSDPVFDEYGMKRLW